MPNYKDKAINAVFYAHPDRLQELIDEGNFPQELLEDVGLLTRPFPIWRITQCWEEAMGDDASAYREKKKVADFMARNKAVKVIFQKAFNVEFAPIDYQSYWENFYANDPNESDEDNISAQETVALAKYGTTPLDIELYCAVEKFDFPRVKELLEKGANPRASTEVNDESDEGCMTRIDTECSYLCTCRLSFAWNPKENDPVGDDEIGDLIGWAAHETMYRLLEKYDHE